MDSDITRSLVERATELRRLHHQAQPLVLANAWDVPSAKASVAAGFVAVATTSGGLDGALGYPDHNVAPVDDVFAAIGRIAGAVDVPVTADCEGGFELEPEAFVERLLAAGAVGCNLEDSDYSAESNGGLLVIDRQAEFIAGVRAAATAWGVDIVINARIDVWVRRTSDDPAARIAEGLRRADAYREAGADCVYPIVASDEETITALVPGGPVNILARPGGPSIQRLTDLGVRRISVGGGLYNAAGRDLATRMAHLHAGDFEQALS